MLADKASDADRIRAPLPEKGAFANIPPKVNRRSKPYFSTWLYRERNLIERFFSKLKHFRRVATRYDKLAENFLAMVQLGSNWHQCACGCALMSLHPSTATPIEGAARTALATRDRAGPRSKQSRYSPPQKSTFNHHGVRFVCELKGIARTLEGS